MMVVATGIITALAMKYSDAIPPLVLTWALVGIVVRFPGELSLRCVGIALAIGLVGLAARVVFRNRRAEMLT
jgi:hypothetical protein